MSPGQCGVALFVGVIDAGGGGIEKLLRSVLLRGLQHVRVDQHGEHAQRLVVLDESHAAHVGGEVVDLKRAAGCDFAIFLEVQVQREILHVVEALVPLTNRLDIHGADLPEAPFSKVGHQAAADETPGAGDHGEFVFHYTPESENDGKHYSSEPT